MNTTAPNSIPSLLKELRDETTTLLRQEVALAKVEMSQKASRFASNSVQVAIGAFVAYAGLIVLLFGVADLLAVLFVRMGVETGTASWLARAAVGLIVILAGWLMLAKAKKALSAESLVPEQTLKSLEENKAWAQAKLQHQS